MADIVLRAALLERWRAFSNLLAVRDGAAKGDALVNAYAGPARRYHGLAHIAFLLGEIDRHAALIKNIAVLQGAAWYHDAVYDPLARDNEERSAAWARRDLEGLSCAEPIATLIEKTKSHHAGDATPDEALFLDMDFAILGAPMEIYAAYATAIREEYAAVPDNRFRAGRASFLGGVLAQPRMFRTDLYEAERGARARENLVWEIGRLRA